MMEILEQEKNKHYLPSIKEFHVGFECEINRNDEGGEWWEQVIIDPDLEFNNSTDFEEILFAHVCHGVRAKYLDRDDIIDLGWKFIRKDNNGLIVEQIFEIDDSLDYGHNWMLQLLLPVGKYFEIQNVAIYYVMNGNEYVKFDGTIKNKSKLKEIMEMVHVYVNK